MEDKRKSTGTTSLKAPPKPKVAGSGSATQPAEQETDRQGETESDRKTEKQAPLTQHQQESSASVSSHRLDKKSAEPHVNHSVEWKWNKEFSLTCDKAGTIEEVLGRSPAFKKIKQKQGLAKELVIIKDSRSISSHFPCCLIKNDLLTVKFVLDKEKESNASDSHSRQRKPPSNKLLTFHVLTKGGKNIQKVMRNPWHDISEVTVYAYKGEKVKHALQRDGRFMSAVFTKTCALSQKSPQTTVEMSDLVDHHDGKTFQIVQLSTDAPPSSLEIDEVQNEAEVSPSNENQDPVQQSTNTELENVDKPRPGDDMSCGEISNSNKVFANLTLIFTKAAKGKKSLPSIRNLFRVEFGKNSQACNEVKTMKQMMELSDSVCFIKTQRKKGTGFLLFDKFVLTNNHVVKDTYDESTGKLNEKVDVHFSYESFGQLGPPVEVTGVVGFEGYTDDSGQTYDWALLELSEGEGQQLPSGLLQHFGFPSTKGGICIIGHPECAAKRLDTCFIVSPDSQDQVLKTHSNENPGFVQIEGSHYGLNPGPSLMLTDQFFGDVAEYIKRSQVLTYESCFYFGSSGSPIFDENCNVVAMHSGGFAYKDKTNRDNSVIEYGHPLYIIVPRLIVQLAIQQKFGVLKKYLTSCNAQHNNLKNVLKKMVDSKHLKEFQAALSHLEVKSDETLKSFFEYFSQKEEPAPKEVDQKYSS